MTSVQSSFGTKCLLPVRECTDLTTGSEPAPIYVDWIWADLLKDRLPILLFIHPINTIQCNRSI